MSSLLRSFQLSLPFIVAAHLPTPSQAQGPPADNIHTESIPQKYSLDEERALEHVMVHLVLIGDVSKSMDDVDRSKLQKGFATSLAFQEVLQQIDQGGVYAISIIYYANNAEHADTRIVKTRKQALEFAAEHFWDVEKDQPMTLPDLGTNTNLYKAYELTNNLFLNEKKYGFHSMTRSIVVASDDLSAGDDALELKNWTLYFEQQHKAVMFAVTIPTQSNPYNYRPGDYADVATYNSSMYEFYQDYVQTQNGAYYLTKDGGKQPLRKGEVARGDRPEDFGPIISSALRVSYY